MSGIYENDFEGVSGLTADLQPGQSAAFEDRSCSDGRSVVVGLYGIPGSGKTYLLSQLKQELGQEHFAFYEGSKMIAAVSPGTLDAFETLEDEEKLHWRQLAIKTIKKECAESGKVGLVAGHYMFWPENEETGKSVCTPSDLTTFTHVLYMNIPAEIVAKRRLDDTKRHRPPIAVSHLCKWQQAEKTQLHSLCRNNGILFSLISLQPSLLNRVSRLMRDFRKHSEEYNLSCAEGRLDEIIAVRSQLETMLLMDGDRTLTAEDTSTLFWNRVSKSRQSRDEEDSLRALFNSRMGYSYSAFRQATLLYEDIADDDEFDSLCQEVSSVATMHSEFISLLRLVAEQEYVGAVVITSGLRCVWEKILEREGLSKTVKVIGGGRITDRFVVTAEVKAALVARLRDGHQIYVWAFGDSPLDLGMLKKADRAVVVVGDERTRSKTMDVTLMNAIKNDGLQARQAVLSSSVSPRLATTELPLIQLTGQEFIDSVLSHRTQNSRPQILHATDRSTGKILMTPMRDAQVAGPLLREAHRRVGWYLATEYLANVIGVEQFPISHVQGHCVNGHRIFHEKQTSIIALMRGGEPMAQGVNEALPLAMFVHANHPNDVMPHHLEGQISVVLVDSVVNSGKTMAKFVQRVRNFHASIRIVIVAGVVHAQSVAEGNLAESLSRHPNLSLIALRLSDNTFTGTHTTDTGNRLFNTAHLP